jgi:tol-pal system protein YbgF
MSLLSTRLDDLDKNLSNRLDLVTEALAGKKTSAPPSPSQLFTVAYNDFTRRRYDAALQGFGAYLEKYGDTEKASEAQYYVGECHAAQQGWDKALEAYDKVLTKYPASSIVPTAYLQKGHSLEKLNRPGDAAEIYEAIVRKYPHRREAQTAQSRLAGLKPAKP